jgi:hypothetical protein
MTDAQLSIPERSALLVLMTFVSAASNSEIRERYGFTIDKPVRRRLEDEGYLTWTTGARNVVVHELTDKGWARCRDELATSLPGRAHRAYRILRGVLVSLDHYLTTTDLTLADFLEPQAKPGVDDVADPRPADDRLRASYGELASRPGAWVGLARLRKALPDVAREEFDDALLRLDLLPQVSLIAEVNQKALTAADRAAAIHVGGDDKHLLSIRPA